MNDIGGRRREGKRRRRIDVLISSVYISQGSGVSGEGMIKVPFHPSFHLYLCSNTIHLSQPPAKECSLDGFLFFLKKDVVLCLIIVISILHSSILALLHACLFASFHI